MEHTMKENTADSNTQQIREMEKAMWERVRQFKKDLEDKMIHIHP